MERKLTIKLSELNETMKNRICRRIYLVRPTEENLLGDDLLNKYNLTLSTELPFDEDEGCELGELKCVMEGLKDSLPVDSNVTEEDKRPEDSNTRRKFRYLINRTNASKLSESSREDILGWLGDKFTADILNHINVEVVLDTEEFKDSSLTKNELMFAVNEVGIAVRESLTPIKKFTVGLEPSLVKLIKEKILADEEFEGVNSPRLKDILKGIDIFFTRPDLPDSLPNHDKFMQHVYDAVMGIDEILEDKMDQIANLEDENEELKERIEELENIVRELAEEAGIHPDDVL